MKNYSIIICLCFLSNLLTGQTYKPILFGNNIEWNYLTDYNIIDAVHTNTLNIHTDTAINNINYKKVLFKGGLYGYIREDTLLKQVLFLKKDSINELLYINYNLSISDTYYLHHNYWPNPKYKLETLIVTNINFINGRKEIKLSNTLAPNYYRYFIEGVGSSIALLEYFDFCTYSDLLCSTVDSSLVYKNSKYNSCDTSFGTSINELNNNKIKIYPNPFSDYIRIESEQKVKICLFSVLGDKVIETNENEINTAQFQSGIYLMQLEQDGKIYWEKIIKR